MSHRSNAEDQWTDQERIDLFREKGRELLNHEFVTAVRKAGGTGFAMHVGDPNGAIGRPVAVSVQGSPALEIQAVEALVRLFFLHTEPTALDQIAGVVGRVDPTKAALLKPILQEYRQALRSRPQIAGAEIMTTGYMDDYTFTDLLDQELFGNATHVNKRPRLARKRLHENEVAQALFGRMFYQQALLIVVRTVSAVMQILERQAVAGTG